MTPLARSMEWLRERGYVVAKAEHWNSFAKRRQDLFGFADLVAVTPGGVILVQVTTLSNASARKRKIDGIVKSWPRPLPGIYVHGWHKREGRWELREHAYTSHGWYRVPILRQAGERA